MLCQWADILFNLKKVFTKIYTNNSSNFTMKKVCAARAIKCYDDGSMLPDSHGVYHAEDSEPIEWVHRDSQPKCFSCGIRDRYPGHTKCTTCGRFGRITQFKLCKNSMDDMIPHCTKIVPAGHRIGEDYCAECALRNQREAVVADRATCEVCNRVKTRNIIDDIPVCAKCALKPAATLRQAVELVKARHSPKNEPVNEESTE